MKRIPRRYPELQVTSYWNKNLQGDLNELAIVVAPNTNIQPANFIAYPIDGVEVLPAAQLETTAQGQTRLLKKVKLYGVSLPQTVAGILWSPGKNRGNPVGVEVELRPASSPKAAETTTQPTAASDAPHVPPGVGALIAMLGLAFLGGLILNIMPCVLPVISLKILGFVQQSKQSPGRVKKMGLLYGLGVVFSFLVLAGIVVAVQKAGGAASWGMQMQNPYFRFALLLVVTLVALNLFGLFEVSLGATVPGAASNIAGKGGALGAFLNGVLATALATPCTAPFLTAALGLAFAQSSAAVILLIFASAAIGLAVPYVLLSWQPAWLKFLPKPGPWMERFKVAMGFPMLATAVWLFDLTAPSFGDGGILWLGLLLVLVGVAAWVWGEFVQRSIRQRKIAPHVAIVFCVAGCAAILEGPLDWRHLNKQAGTETARQNPTGRIDWQPWSKEAVEKARAEGRPVLVDFTARWCLTCKSNEKFAIETSQVREKLRLINAAAFKADNTDPNPEITAELKKHGRAGVPLVVVYPRRTNQPPIVLPTVLTPGLVLDALETAGK
ncbi:MAG: thioredoxin family protein [Verrucomicrobiota bacterium]|nr:thioredoxin family protein [Verrucomicrobiota bacterium]